MMDLQKRLQELRQHLDDGIKIFQSQQRASFMNQNNGSGSDSDGQSGGLISACQSNRRILHILYQDEGCVCIQISGTMIKKAPMAKGTKVSGKNGTIFGKKDLLMKSVTTPLEVNIGSGIQHQQQQPSMINASATTNNFMASSPAGSVDSGMSSLSSTNSSPNSSPGCSPNSIQTEPFQYGAITEQQVISRGRSTSESVHATSGLKGILKKSTSSNVAGGRFSRSFSECQSREDENIKVTVIEMGNEDNAGRISRKKRVSFSERLVQERSFRPNSSILGQKKKNQRKHKNKLKKKGTSLSEDSSTDDEARHRSDSETSRHIVCSEKEDEIDPIAYDLAACDLEDELMQEKDEQDDELTNYCEAGKIHERILRGSTGEQHRVYFTVGEEKCQC